MHRLDQTLSNLGYCSRNEARAWLKAGRVLVKGAPASDPSEKADPKDILVDGEPLDHPEGVLIAYNKPLGQVCTRDAREGETVFSVLPERWQRRNPPVATVGRLDKDTTGLLIMTDQGVLAHRLASPRHKVAKTYRAEVDKDLSPDLVSIFASGTFVLEGEEDPCAPAELKIVGPRVAELTLTEGRFRQVRRMFAGQGYLVTALCRIRFGALGLDGISEGEWRELPLDFFGV